MSTQNSGRKNLSQRVQELEAETKELQDKLDNFTTCDCAEEAILGEKIEELEIKNKELKEKIEAFPSCTCDEDTEDLAEKSPDSEKVTEKSAELPEEPTEEEEHTGETDGAEDLTLEELKSPEGDMAGEQLSSASCQCQDCQCECAPVSGEVMDFLGLSGLEETDDDSLVDLCEEGPQYSAEKRISICEKFSQEKGGEEEEEGLGSSSSDSAKEPLSVEEALRKRAFKLRVLCTFCGKEFSFAGEETSGSGPSVEEPSDKEPSEEEKTFQEISGEDEDVGSFSPASIKEPLSVEVERALKQRALKRGASCICCGGGPTGEPSGEKPSGEEPSGEEPSGEEPLSMEPSEEEPHASAIYEKVSQEKDGEDGEEDMGSLSSASVKEPLVPAVVHSVEPPASGVGITGTGQITLSLSLGGDTSVNNIIKQMEDLKHCLHRMEARTQETDEKEQEPELTIQALAEQLDDLKCKLFEESTCSCTDKADKVELKAAVDELANTDCELLQSLQEKDKKIEDLEWQLQRQVEDSMDGFAKKLDDFLQKKLNRVNQRMGKMAIIVNDLSSVGGAGRTKFIKGQSCLSCGAGIVMRTERAQPHIKGLRPRAMRRYPGTAPNLRYGCVPNNGTTCSGNRTPSGDGDIMSMGSGDVDALLVKRMGGEGRRHVGGAHTTSTPSQRVIRTGDFSRDYIYPSKLFRPSQN